MDKIWVKDVKEGERLKSVFLVSRKAVPTAKSGKTYLSVTLQDKTGELEARAFEKVEELAPLFEEKAHVEVEGPVGSFQGKAQLKIETATAVGDAAQLDPAEFAFAPPPEPRQPEKSGFSEQDETLWRELLGFVEAITDPNVKALVKAFVDDEDVVARLRRVPAAKTIHHGYPGGLLEHTVACLKLSHRLADQYPQADRDLLAAGAFFHDLGKTRELSGERGAEYTDEGRLVGHHVMTAQWIHDKCRRLGLPRDLEHHVVHLVLAHHGKLEYGSPKVPMTLEALLTHHVDELDSRVNSWLGLMAREGGSRRWTSADNVYEQTIWRGALPTVQAEKKAPPAELMTPVIYVPRESGGGQPWGGAGTGPGAARKARSKEKRREPRAAGEAHPAGTAEAMSVGSAEVRPLGTPGSETPRQPRPERSARPDRGPREQRGPGGPGGPGGAGAPGGFGDRKRSSQGPRMTGDQGTQRPQAGKPLTHNPFAALAAKLAEAGRGAAAKHEEPPAPTEAAPEHAPAAGVEPTPEPRLAVAPSVPAEPAASEAKPTEGA
jgi:3'-5' exoribonuclease